MHINSASYHTLGNVYIYDLRESQNASSCKDLKHSSQRCHLLLLLVATPGTFLLWALRSTCCEHNGQKHFLSTANQTFIHFVPLHSKQLTLSFRLFLCQVIFFHHHFLCSSTLLHKLSLYKSIQTNISHMTHIQCFPARGS